MRLNAAGMQHAVRPQPSRSARILEEPLRSLCHQDGGQEGWRCSITSGCRLRTSSEAHNSTGAVLAPLGHEAGGRDATSAGFGPRGAPALWLYASPEPGRGDHASGVRRREPRRRRRLPQSRAERRRRRQRLPRPSRILMPPTTTRPSSSTRTARISKRSASSSCRGYDPQGDHRRGLSRCRLERDPRRGGGPHAAGARIRAGHAAGGGRRASDIRQRARGPRDRGRHRRAVAPVGLSACRGRAGRTSPCLFRGLPHGPSGTRLVWITDVLPDTIAPEFEAMIEEGSAVIRRTLTEQLSCNQRQRPRPGAVSGSGGLPITPRRHAGRAPEGADEVREVGEADVEGHRGDRPIPLQQQARRGPAKPGLESEYWCGVHPTTALKIRRKWNGLTAASRATAVEAERLIGATLDPQRRPHGAAAVARRRAALVAAADRPPPRRSARRAAGRPRRARCRPARRRRSGRVRRAGSGRSGAAAPRSAKSPRSSFRWSRRSAESLNDKHSSPPRWCACVHVNSRPGCPSRMEPATSSKDLLPSR